MGQFNSRSTNEKSVDKKMEGPVVVTQFLSCKFGPIFQ